MFVRRIEDDQLAQVSYLIGCQRTGEAIVVDPERDIDRYIELAAEQGLTIVAATETHIHADFISGLREFGERGGTLLLMSGEGGEDWTPRWLDQQSSGGSYKHQLLKDGETFSIGNIEFKVVHTPGHTPEHISFLVTDHGGGADTPMAILDDAPGRRAGWAALLARIALLWRCRRSRGPGPGNFHSGIS